MSILNKKIDEDENINFIINSRLLDIDTSFFEKCLNPDFNINKIENLRASNKNILNTINLNPLKLNFLIKWYKFFTIDENLKININDFRLNLNILSKEISKNIDEFKNIIFNKNIFKKKEKIKFKKYKL